MTNKEKLTKALNVLSDLTLEDYENYGPSDGYTDAVNTIDELVADLTYLTNNIDLVVDLLESIVTDLEFEELYPDRVKSSKQSAIQSQEKTPDTQDQPRQK